MQRSEQRNEQRNWECVGKPKQKSPDFKTSYLWWQRGSKFNILTTIVYKGDYLVFLKHLYY